MGSQNSSYSILAVDDSDIIINLLQILLNGAGYDFCSANSASAAMSSIKQQNFDLVLMDIEMPDISGVALLKEMKEQDLLQNTKVIMLTAKTDVTHVKECLELGAACYILKPFDHQSILNRISEILQEE